MMLRRRRVVIAILAMAILVLAAAVLGAAPQSMSVTVRETQARATPSFLGAVLAVLSYGDRVDILATQRDWMKVALPGGREGWVHQSALTEKRVVLQAGSGSVEQSASGEEVALAGKGFNKEVEAQYKAENELDYTWVDRMEGFVVSPQQILAFVEAGQLRFAEGGSQ
jgi:SH3-like domain-containing protein